MKSLLICLMVFSSKPNPRIQKSNIIINKTRDLSNSELDSDLRKGYDERYDNPIKNSSVFEDDENKNSSLEKSGIWKSKIPAYINFIKCNALKKIMPLQKKIYEFLNFHNLKDMKGSTHSCLSLFEKGMKMKSSMLLTGLVLISCFSWPAN